MKNDKQKIIEARAGFFVIYYGNHDVEGVWVCKGEPVLFWCITHGLTDRDKISANLDPITINGDVDDRDWALLNPDGSVSDPMNQEFESIDIFKEYLKLRYEEDTKEKATRVRGKTAASPQPPVQ